MKITFDNVSINEAHQLLCVADPNRTAKLVEVENTSNNTGSHKILQAIDAIINGRGDSVTKVAKCKDVLAKLRACT